MSTRAVTKRRLAIAAVVAVAASWIGFSAPALAVSPAPAVSASAWTGLVANNQFPNDAVTTFDPLAETTGQNIAVAGDNLWVGPSPDGSKAYVSVVYPNPQLDVVDLSTDSVTSHVSIPGGLYWGALSPNGRLVYLAGSGTVQPIDVTTLTAATPISVPDTGEVAFSPDGQTAWVASGPSGGSADGVVPIDVATGTVGSLIPTGNGAFGVAVSPDGSTVWVSNTTDQTVSEIDAASRTVIRTISIAAGNPETMAMSPDGSRLWVTLRSQHELTWIYTADGSVGTAIDTGTPKAVGVAITPDGRTVFVTDGSSDGTGRGTQVTPVDATASPPAAQTAMVGYVDPVWVAITPDQAPVANFTVQAAPPGSATQFDASSSQAPSTPIVSYRWSFGDGSTATTSTPTVSHVYAQPGSYQASVTETDSAGTSTTAVYTGQQMLRNGGPQATATRSVLVSYSGVPQVRLSAGTLDFGTVGVGKTSAPQTVTLTNTGTAPLSVSSTTVGGGNGGDFHVTSDACAGATIAPGSSCTASVTFSPGADGPRTGQVAFTDNASGSPQTVFLTGSGTSTGSLAGTVTSGSGGAVGGASVSVCTYSTRAVCKSATTASNGDYSVTRLPPGTYQVEVFPPNAGLFSGSAVVNVTVGDTATQDFTLSPPRPLPPGFTLSSGVGTFTSGVPRSFWTDPLQLSVPLTAPTGGQPGDVGSTDITFWSSPAGAGSRDRPWGNLIVTYRYDASGTPRFTAMAANGPTIPGPSIGTWTMGLGQNAVAGQTDVNSLTAVGTLTPPANGPYFHGATDVVTSQSSEVLAPVGAATDHARAHGGFPVPAKCKLPSLPTTNIPSPPKTRLQELQQQLQMARRQYAIDAASRAPNQQALKRDINKINSIQQQINQLIQSQQQQQAPQQPVQPTTYPAGYQGVGTTGAGSGGSVGGQQGGDEFTQNGIDYYNGGGWQDATPAAPVPHARAGAGVAYASAAAGDSGTGCADDNITSDYHDPSGLVQTRQHIPVAGAKVVLLRSARRHGRYRPVRNGSVVMSPANRRNPDHTNALGAFGWDVLRGFYRISARRAGCRGSALTRVLEVPPPAFNLTLVLDCPSIHRAATRTTAKAHKLPPGFLLLVARVRVARVRGRAAGHRPLGMVAFMSAGRVLGVAPLNTRTGTASLTIRARRVRGRVRASYRGDGYFAPSHS